MSDTPIADAIIAAHNEANEVNTDYSDEQSNRIDPRIAG